MWLLFGISAIFMTLFNVIYSLRNKDSKWFRYLGISFTALTLCSFYWLESRWVINQDWSALMDTMPAMANILWFLTAASILVNSISLFKTKNENVR